MLSRRIIQEEEIPERFSETVLHQLWKNKFPKEDLKNHRFIHIKDWLPRCMESLIVGKMKVPILEAGSKCRRCRLGRPAGCGLGGAGLLQE